MRRCFILGLALIGSFSTVGSSAQAQAVAGGGASMVFSDPFLSYYGFFVPQQLYYASRPRVEDTIQQYSAARQYSALTERAGLYDPIGSLDIESDPLRAFGSASGRSRLPSTSPAGLVNNNLRGTGPGGYYNRTGSYYPTLRIGRGGNGGLNPISGGASRVRNLGGGARRGVSFPRPSGGLSIPGMPG